jgi:hypothetical protein
MTCTKSKSRKMTLTAARHPARDVYKNACARWAGPLMQGSSHARAGHTQMVWHEASAQHKEEVLTLAA